MKIFITGGTGFVGRYLCNALIDKGHQLTVLSRSKRHSSSKNITFIKGDPAEKGKWQRILNEHDAVINLAGSSIFTRWNSKSKKLIKESRILSTQNIVEVIENMSTVLINASAIGYYGHSRSDKLLTEESKAGNDFLAEVCKEWEAETLKASEKGIRVVICRFGIVMGKNGGALKKMLTVFKIGAGSPLGRGKQWFSWVHEEDLSNMIMFALENETITGPVNCVAPEPVTNKVLTKTLGKVIHRPTIMPAVPSLVLKAVLGEFGNVLLEGQRVKPQILLENNFHYKFPEIETALEDLLN